MPGSPNPPRPFFNTARLVAFRPVRYIALPCTCIANPYTNPYRRDLSRQARRVEEALASSVSSSTAPLWQISSLFIKNLIPHFAPSHCVGDIFELNNTEC